MDRRRSRWFTPVAGGAVLAAALFAAPVSAAGPGAHASCMGIELAAISPPGTSDEIPGGAPAFAAEIKGIAAFLGVPPGVLFSTIARIHAGSHEACDAALE
jgi:hypothetical protein